MTFKRLHVLPRRYRRHALPGLSTFEQLLGTESPRQRWIRQQSRARYRRRDDAYDPAEMPFRGEIGRYDGFVFVSGTAPVHIGFDFAAGSQPVVARGRVVSGALVIEELSANVTCSLSAAVADLRAVSMPEVVLKAPIAPAAGKFSDRPWLKKRKGRS